MAGQTLYDKLWRQHLVKERDDGTALIYIDRQLLHSGLVYTLATRCAN